MVERSYLEQFQPSLEDIKRHLRVTSDDLNDTLELYLRAAIEASEKHIGKVIAVSQFTYSGWFVRSFDMLVPFRKVVSVTVDDRKLESDDYTIEKRTLIIHPEITGERLIVTYEAGYSQVPFDMKAAILLTAAKLFNNPVDSVESLPSVARNLLRPYRTWGIEDGTDC